MGKIIYRHKCSKRLRSSAMINKDVVFKDFDKAKPLCSLFIEGADIRDKYSGYLYQVLGVTIKEL